MVTKLAVHIPGQGIRVVPDVDSFKLDSNLKPVVEATYEAFSNAVAAEFGSNVPAEIMQADRQTLEQNTLFAQLRFFLKSTATWMALMKDSFYGEPTLEQLVSEGLVEIQLSGHSLGAAIASYLPGPGHLDDQLTNISWGAKSVGKRAMFMLNTPNDYAEGGMAAVGMLGGWQVNKLVKRVNRRLGYEGAIQVVTHNAPKLKVVSGPRDGLDLMRSYVQATNGAFIDRVSQRWFHHNWVMKQPAFSYGRYLEELGTLGTPCPLFRHVSYVTGTEIPISGLKQDLVEGVSNPVYYFTFRGPSVHGATYKNGFYNVVVFASEFVSWLKESQNVRTHFIRNLDSLEQEKHEIMRVINGEFPVGLKATMPTTPPPALSRSTPYQTES